MTIVRNSKCGFLHLDRWNQKGARNMSCSHSGKGMLSPTRLPWRVKEDVRNGRVCRDLPAELEQSNMIHNTGGAGRSR